MLLLPVAVAVGPAASATQMDYCPTGTPVAAASMPSAAGWGPRAAGCGRRPDYY